MVAAVAAVAAVVLPSCNTVDDDRIPSMPVSINLSPQGIWDTYGVFGYGDYRYFIKQEKQPSGFFYNDRSYTGFGGVLLISGVDAFTSEAGVPLAYDLSCPYERKPDIRVRMVADGILPMAVCPECGSKYDVTESGGNAIEGPARSEHLGMTRYKCLSASGGGYIIVN